MKAYNNTICKPHNIPEANTSIFACYETGTDALDENGLITVIKLGSCARKLRITDVEGKEEIWCDIIKPGDAIIMTMKANSLYMPAMDNAGVCESIIFRTSKELENKLVVCASAFHPVCHHKLTCVFGCRRPQLATVSKSCSHIFPTYLCYGCKYMAKTHYNNKTWKWIHQPSHRNTWK